MYKNKNKTNINIEEINFVYCGINTPLKSIQKHIHKYKYGIGATADGKFIQSGGSKHVYFYRYSTLTYSYFVSPRLCIWVAIILFHTRDRPLFDNVELYGVFSTHTHYFKNLFSIRKTCRANLIQ